MTGKLGKQELNLEYVKSLVFQHFLLEEGEQQETEWAKYVVAIDEKYHNLNKTKI